MPIFGVAVSIEQVPQQAAQQAEAFFGVPGYLSVFGGTRGRTFQISGVLYDVDIPSLNADETFSLRGSTARYADRHCPGACSTTRGRSWANVIYLGQALHPRPDGTKARDLGTGAAGGSCRIGRCFTGCRK